MNQRERESLARMLSRAKDWKMARLEKKEAEEMKKAEEKNELENKKR